MPTVPYQFGPSSLSPLDDGGNHPQPDTADLGTVTVKVLDFDDSTVETSDLDFFVHPDLDTSGSVTFRIAHFAATAAASRNTEYRFAHRAIANGEPIDGAYTNEDSGDLAMDATQDDENIHTWSETVTNLGWAANDHVYGQLSRIAPSANNLVGDDRVTLFAIELPIT